MFDTKLVTLGSIVITTDTPAQKLLREYIELYEKLEEVKEKLAKAVKLGETVVVGEVKCKWNKSTRYNHEGIVAHYEELKSVTPEIRALFTTVNYTELSNYLNPSKDIKNKFKIEGDPNFTISIPKKNADSKKGK